jgi:hypothetical protein
MFSPSLSDFFLNRKNFQRKTVLESVPTGHTPRGQPDK